MPYDVGDLIRIVASFSASIGRPVDPASVYMLTKDPVGAVTTYGYPASITRVATGAYYVDVVASRSGDWRWRYAGAPSEGRSAIEDKFSVNQSAFLL